MTKKCNKCDTVKPASLQYFSANKKFIKNGGLNNWCKDCVAEWFLIRKYGITISKYRETLSAQDGRCAICRCIPGKRAFHVDHDHVTGAVRGLLCGKCNMGIGLFNEDENILFAAVKYLRIPGR